MRYIDRTAAAAVLIVAAVSFPKPALSQSLEPSLRQIGVSAETQALGNHGAGVKVGVFDTPIDWYHPNVEITGGIDLHWGSGLVYSEHGTHVAGTIAGSGGYGIATDASLYDVSVLSPFGSWANGVTLRGAMNQAADAGISIANMSFGYSGGYTLDYDEYRAIWQNRKKLLVVKAAGNDGLALTSVKSRKGAKGKLDNLMLVGSVDRNNRLSSFSNRPGRGCFARLRGRGGNKKWKCREKDQYKYYFIVAPGEDIRSSVPGGGTARLSGTSMATPHVVGAAALLQGRWEHLRRNPVATANILFKTATDLGAEGVDNRYGWGLLNVERAMQPIGDTYLYSGGKKFPRGTSGIKGTGRLDRMLGWNSRINRLSMFDAYDRDFSVSPDQYATSADPRIGDRLLGLIAGASHHAYESVGTERTFSFGDAVDIRYALGTARETADPLTGGPPKDNMEAYLDTVHGTDPVGTWTFSMSDPEGGWSVVSGSGGFATPFSLTSMNGHGLGGITTGEDLENPVLGLVEDGTYAGTHLKLAEGVRLTFGLSDGKDEDFLDATYSTFASVMGVSVEPLETVKLGLAATRLSEDNGLFASVGSGALSLGDAFQTDAVTFSSEVQLAKDWVISAAYSLASTTQKNGSDLLRFDGRMISDASAVAISGSNVMVTGDRLSFAASLPLATISGAATSRIASHYDINGEMQFTDVDHDLRETERPVELTLGYATPTGPGIMKMGVVGELNARTNGGEAFGAFWGYSQEF